MEVCGEQSKGSAELFWVMKKTVRMYVQRDRLTFPIAHLLCHINVSGFVTHQGNQPLYCIVVADQVSCLQVEMQAPGESQNYIHTPLASVHSLYILALFAP